MADRLKNMGQTGLNARSFVMRGTSTFRQAMEPHLFASFSEERR